MNKAHTVLGIDIGGTGIKGALVDTRKGVLLTERYRIPTPQPATPQKVAKTVAELVKHFDWKGKIGYGFPAILKKGVAHSAANIDKAWIGTNVEKLFAKATGCPAVVVNDADAAGAAELRFGKGKDQTGVVIIITIGTGLGSSVFINGELLPNTELGHFYLKGSSKVAEKYCSNAVRKRENLSWEAWAKRFSKYLKHLEHLFSPDLIILGGGSSKKFDNYKNYLSNQTPTIPAELRNNAGIIGAAVLAKK